ncbi:MAG TPA: hypothetical protein VMU54_13735, partial [Planctomycetota bacterium]|nr:hypothetical protein [Planctomycetota bacterium]
CFFEIDVEPEQTYAAAIWHDAKGKDVLKIGSPEEGPVTKGSEATPEPQKKEEPPPPPEARVEEPKPVPEPLPAPLPERTAASAPPALPKVVDPVPPPPKEAPDGGVADPAPAVPALGTGATAGVPQSERPGLAKGADGAPMSDAEIEKDPTAAIRRRRAGTLTALREGSQRDIVVVTGRYDHIQEILDRLEIPYSILEPEQVPKYDLSNCKVLLINCNNTYDQGLFRLANSNTIQKDIEALEEKEAALRKRVQEAKEKRKVFELGLELLKATSTLSELRERLAAVTGANELVENVRKFVESGGYLFSSDWGISILERSFPGTVKNGGLIGPRTVSLRPKPGVKNPLLDEVFYTGPKNQTVVSKRMLWEIDSGSYAVKVEKATVDILAEAPELQKNNAIAVAFGPDRGTGKVLHVLSHFDRQATRQGDYALQNLLLNFLMERVKR